MPKRTGLIPATLALVVTLGFFGVLVYLVKYGKPDGSSDALLIMLGSLGTAWGTVMSYYFGTTANGARKTELLAQAAPVKDGP